MSAIANVKIPAMIFKFFYVMWKKKEKKSLQNITKKKIKLIKQNETKINFTKLKEEKKK